MNNNQGNQIKITKNNKRTKTNKFNCNLANILIIFFMCCPILEAKTYIKKIDVQPGICYDGFGTINLISHNWYLINSIICLVIGHVSHNYHF